MFSYSDGTLGLLLLDGAVGAAELIPSTSR